MKFHQKLAKYLERPDWSQARIVRMTGLSQSAVSEMTSGKRRPYLDQAWLIARAMGVSLDFLADEDQDEPAAAYTPEDKVIVRLCREEGISLEDVLALIRERQRPGERRRLPD